MRRTNKKSGLLLAPKVFETLHQDILNHFESNYHISADTMVDYQVYGFNNYDRDKASIKNLVFERTGKAINGKYLYNKYREWKRGVSPIKLTREFVYIYFKTLGYKNVRDFVLNYGFSDADIFEQTNLEKTIVTSFSNEYYVGYFIGEEDNIVATHLTLFKESFKVRFSMIYWEKADEYSEYIYDGTILYQQNGMSLFFRHNENDLDRSLLINIFCEPHTKVKPVLLGAYAGYDRNRQPAVGEIVFKRVASVEEQNELVRQKGVNTIIAQYISGKRWKSLGKNLQRVSDLSSESKFADIIDSFITSYRGVFVSVEEGVFIMEMDIQDNLGNSVLNIAGHPTYTGTIKVQASGQLLIGTFINATTRAPLFISIEVLPIREGVFAGNMLGVSRFDKSFSGKIYLSNREGIKQQLPEYRGAELIISEIENLPQVILSDMSGILKNNRLEKPFNFTKNKTSLRSLLHLAGDYQVQLEGSSEKKLTIQADGLSTLEDKHLVYSGKAMMCEGGILSIYFTDCNGIPNCSQIMAKVGRKSIHELTTIKGNWFYVDEGYEQKIAGVELNPRLT